MEAAMLDRAHRLRRRGEFAAAIRRGRRAGRGTLVVHLLRPGRPGYPTAPHPTGSRQPADPDPGVPSRAGFIVPRAVGGAVIRNTVRRRLRHLVRPHLAALPVGSMLVIRALPPAAGAGAATLEADLAAALRVAIRTSPAPPASAVRDTTLARVDAGSGDPVS